MYVSVKNNWQKQYLQLARTAHYELSHRLREVRAQAVRYIHAYPATLIVLPIFIFSFALYATATHRDSLAFSLATDKDCFNKLVPLPDLQKTTASNSYNLSLENPVALGPVKLLARKACITRRSLITEKTHESVHFALFGNGLIKQKISVNTPAFPVVNLEKLRRGQISSTEPLVLATDNADVVFDYVVHANNQETTCAKSNQQLSCPVKELNLGQGQSHNMHIYRSYKGTDVGKVFSGDVLTATPVQILSSTIANGSTVFDKPTEVTFTTNKKLTAYDVISLVGGSGENAKTYDIKITINDTQVTVSFNQPLERQKDFTLRINNLTAEDYGQLDQPYVLAFRTSGGPKVSAVNIKSYGVLPGQAVELKFDQDILAGQNIAAFVSLNTSQGVVPATLSVSGRRVVITPTTPLAKCVAFTVRVNDGLQSNFGITGGTSWSMQSRTQCVSISVIGYSVQGRPIYAYSFGTGASKIIFVGNMHGDEKSSKYLLDQWINELEANADKIPASRSLIIIPSANPDGFALSSRLNANNVDLNRNFPADDWAASVGVPGPQTLPQGGGVSPLSEPESNSLAVFIQNNQPRLVLTFHSKGGVVIPNGSGDSSALAKLYADKSPYWLGSDDQADSIFGYATTGELEDWLHDKRGIPTLLIEMSSDTGSEFAGNRPALWHMATLP